MKTKDHSKKNHVISSGQLVYTKSERLQHRIYTGLLVILCILILLPIIYAFFASFKTFQDAVNHPLSLIPREFTWQNYQHVFERIPFFQIVLNTFLVATVVTSLKLLTSIMAAYALVFLPVRHKNAVYYLLISTMFIPFTVTMIPNYMTISSIGLRDHLVGVMLPQLADALGIFLIHQSMRTVPKSLIEYATIDQIGNRRMIADIIIPLIRPSIISTGIMFFINSWNEYVWPVLILKSKEHYTLSLALQMFLSSEGGTEFPVAMAVSVLTMIVPLLLYIMFQRYIINTFSMSGLKG